MNQLGGFPLLTLIVFLPLLGAAAVGCVPRAPAGREDAVRWLAFLIAAAVFFVALFLYMGWVDDPAGTLQFVDGPWPWVPDLGVQYHLGIDGIGLHFALLSTLLTPLALWLAWPQLTRSQAAGMLLVEAGVLGAIASFDMVLWVAFWLLAMLATPLAGGGINAEAQRRGGTQRGDRAAGQPGSREQPWGGTWFWIAMAVAAACMLAVLAGLSARQAGFGLFDLLANPPGWEAQAWPFWGLACALGITGVVFPLFWQGGIQRAASPAASMLIGALLPNLGVYGFIRLGLALFPLAAVSFAPAMVLLGAAGMLYGALAALGAASWPATLACWNMSQVGLSLVGIFAMQDLGVHGAVAHLFGRGVSAAALAVLAGALTPNPSPSSLPTFQPSDVGRGERAMAALGFLSALGVPGLAGFVGQGMVVLGMLRWHWQVSASRAVNRWLDWALYLAVALGLLVGAWALLRAWRGMGRRTPDRAARTPAGRARVRQALVAIPLLIAIFLFGLRPQGFSDMTGPAVYRLLSDVDAGVRASLQRMASESLSDPVLLGGEEAGLPLPGQGPAPGTARDE